MNREIAQICIAAIAMLTLVFGIGGGCAGSGGTVSNLTQTTGPLTGTWSGLGLHLSSNNACLTCDWTDVTADITMDLTQNGNSVTGTVTTSPRGSAGTCIGFSGTRAVGNGAVSGNVFTFTTGVGNNWRMNLTSSDVRTSMAGRITNSTGSQCNGITSPVVNSITLQRQ